MSNFPEVMLATSRIIAHYKKVYKDKFDTDPTFNRVKIKYNIADILDDLSEDEILELISYFVATDKNPTLLRFVYEYDEIKEQKKLNANDVAARKALLRETQKTVQEFRKRFGKNEE